MQSWSQLKAALRRDRPQFHALDRVAGSEREAYIGVLDLAISPICAKCIPLYVLELYVLERWLFIRAWLRTGYASRRVRALNT